MREFRQQTSNNRLTKTGGTVGISEAGVGEGRHALVPPHTPYWSMALGTPI